jgi:hypothetical protein
VDRLAFGNQAFTEWVDRHQSTNTVWGWFLHTLAWPKWLLTAFHAAEAASACGLFVGWIVGVAVTTAKSAG